MKGIVFICGTDSTILERRCDTLGLPEAARLLDLVPSTSQEQAERFLMTVRTNKAAFNWKFELNTKEGKRLCYFAGVFDGDDVTVVGAESRAGVTQMYRDLIEINNEQTNNLRSVLKDQSLNNRQREEEDRHLYEELARVNNELATLQRELFKKNSELAKLDQQKNQFIGILAHDLRNPLSLVMGYAEFLETDLEGKLDDEKRDFLQVIQRSSEFMLGLVNDLLDLSVIETGQLQLNKTQYDIQGLVLESVSLNRPIAGKKQIQIVCSVDHDQTFINGDRLKVFQVLNNVISNAIKYSPAASVVGVTLREQPEDVEISISDQGAGIETAELSRIFDPYQRGSTRPTAGESSTGLGLAIVKRIIEGHGGQLRVESTPGKGTVFSFSLPKSAPRNDPANFFGV
jgi:two-component system, OmpR family, sensor kinase